jgi:hypothetical protein
MKDFIRKRIKEAFGDDILSKLKALPSELKLYRVVFLEDKNDLDVNTLGSHYSLSKEVLSASHSDVPHNGAKGKPYMLTVVVPKSSIDVLETIKNRELYPHEEEITLKNKGVGGKVIKIEPFKSTTIDFNSDF